MTNYSKKLFSIAKQLSNEVDDDLANEIVLHGSINTNMSDKYSDIEMDFINTGIPSRKKINDWISNIGGCNIKINEDLEEDGALCSSFIYGNYRVEIIWQTYDNMESVLNKIYSLDTTNHGFFVYAWSLNTAQILKDNGKIKKYIQKIKIYPKGLSNKLISYTINRSMRNPISCVASIKRKEFFNLTFKMVRDMEDILRLLYAINASWEPYWKWVAHNVDNLSIKPKRLSSKINSIYLNLNNPKKALTLILGLRIEVLEILEKINSIDVSVKIKESKDSLALLNF